MVVKNLEFFDKDGYSLNLNWNSKRGIWEGNIFFPRVSVGLYENTTIYITEYMGEYIDDSDIEDIYSYPTGKGMMIFQWDMANTFVDEFFMFNFDADYEIKDTSALIYTPYDGPICETLIINRFDKYRVPLLSDSIDYLDRDDLMEVHIAFKANDNTAETTYKRTLVISYDDGNRTREIARLTFFAETIEEDERLKIWNENLGYKLRPEETIIFKNSDIHECLPDFELLNEKRKELMLEGQNIYPYIGGYKALLNAIKFFGYDNLNIIEYWRNINEYDAEYGKIYRTYVYTLKDRKTLSTRRRPISLDTKDFQKLNTISLAYNINHPERDPETNRKYDEYGLPNVIEDFDKDKRDDFVLTIEEALIKLFALRNKLNNEFMPGSTKITDIIGEGHYFGLNLIGNNAQISTVNYIESKGTVNFSVFPSKYCYLTENEDFVRYIAEIRNIKVDENIEKLGDKTIADLVEMYKNVDSDSDSDGDSDSDITISELDSRTLGNILGELLKNENDVVCGYYEDYYNITYDNKYGDAENYGLRNLPEPRNIYRDIVLDDVPNDPYGENNIVPDMRVCAKAILVGEFDEEMDIGAIVQWKVTHPESGWSETFFGDAKTYAKAFVQLPYLGNYDVEMTAWNGYNHCCKKSTKDAIIVEPYNIDIKGFYLDARPLPNGLKYDLFIPQEYEEKVEKTYRYYLWSITDGDVKRGIVTNRRKPMDITLTDIFGEYVIDGVDGYMGLENIREIDKENWISIVNTEKDGDDVLNIAWIYHNDEKDVTLYGVDTFNFEGELEDVPFDENDSYVPDWNDDALYHVIKKNVDKMYSWALQEHMSSDDENTTMRNYRPDGSVNNEGPYYKFDVDNILYKLKKGYAEYNHLNEEIINLEHGEHYKYVRYINSVVDIKPLTWVLLGFDHSRITGRLINSKYPKWTLTLVGDNMDPDEYYSKDRVIATHNGLYFTYLFEDEGEYKIKLEMMDINGNTYEHERTIVIVDSNANYNMYHTLKDEYDKYLEMKNDRNFININ